MFITYLGILLMLVVFFSGAYNLLVEFDYSFFGNDYNGIIINKENNESLVKIFIDGNQLNLHFNEKLISSSIIIRHAPHFNVFFTVAPSMWSFILRIIGLLVVSIIIYFLTVLSYNGMGVNGIKEYILNL